MGLAATSPARRALRAIETFMFVKVEFIVELL
jgi:hypothetical protein